MKQIVSATPPDFEPLLHDGALDVRAFLAEHREQTIKMERGFAEQLEAREELLDARQARLEAADGLTRDAYKKLKATKRAKEWVDAEERAASGLTVPAGITLTDLLAEPDAEVQYRIQDLWPSGGRVLLPAPMKSGKTTMVANLVRALADGDLFLGEFSTEQVSRVAVIDNEMSPAQIKRWMRDQGIKNTDRVEMFSLRGAVASFDLLNPQVRAQWAAALHGADVLVVDCLRPILDALGLSEDKEAGRFLVNLDALVAEAGIQETILVHHTGHAGERSRGDSRLRDWPEAEWTIVRDTKDDQAPRYFRAFGRDVSVPEGRLVFDPANRHLSFTTGADRQTEVVQAVAAEVLTFIAENPGLSSNRIEGEVTGDDKTIRRALTHLERAGRARCERTYSKGGGKVANSKWFAEADPDGGEVY